MDIKHTPGPWNVVFYGSGQANVQMPRGRSFVFGTVYGASGVSNKDGSIGISGHVLDGLTETEYQHQRAADAYLIAAAPDLYAALGVLLRSAEAIHSFGLSESVPPLTAVCFSDSLDAARSALALAVRP